MLLNILCFGITKDIVTDPIFDFDTEGGGTVAHFEAQFLEKYPLLKNLNTLRIAINNAYVDDYQQIIGTNDEIALIPPVSGG